jgi:hypothetical protein
MAWGQVASLLAASKSLWGSYLEPGGILAKSGQCFGSSAYGQSETVCVRLKRPRLIVRFAKPRALAGKRLP